MSNRLIKSRARTSSMQLADCLGSLLALELLSPSPELFLVSPWISDMPVLQNQFGQFRPLLPETGRIGLGLALVLQLLAERGTAVHVICRSDQDNSAFLRKLPEEVLVRRTDDLHEKGLVTNRFYLRGSMNFTYSGIKLNRESVELTNEPYAVNLALTEVRQDWKNLA